MAKKEILPSSRIHIPNSVRDIGPLSRLKGKDLTPRLLKRKFPYKCKYSGGGREYVRDEDYFHWRPNFLEIPHTNKRFVIRRPTPNDYQKSIDLISAKKVPFGEYQLDFYPIIDFTGEVSLCDNGLAYCGENRVYGWGRVKSPFRYTDCYGLKVEGSFPMIILKATSNRQLSFLEEEIGLKRNRRKVLNEK
jgi:hypothetical protein